MSNRGSSHSSIKKINPSWAADNHRKGRYRNMNNAISGGLRNPFDWKFSLKMRLKNRKREHWTDDSVPLKSIDIEGKDYIVWLGHSSFFLKINQSKLLIDPVFGEIPLVKRIVKMPADRSIFKNIDYILLTHDHYDHLDKKSIKTVARQSQNLKVLCGLGTDRLINSWKENIEAIPMDWYDRFSINSNLKIIFLPASHWSKRKLHDGGKRLWGAFLIKTDKMQIYISGDTNYGDHFKEVNELFGAVDYAIIGIGAFRPRMMMKRNHISPREAIWASKDLNAKRTIPMHYGTFDLSRERYAEPLTIFNKAAEIRGVDTMIPKAGEVIFL